MVPDEVFIRQKRPHLFFRCPAILFFRLVIGVVRRKHELVGSSDLSSFPIRYAQIPVNAYRFNDGY